MIKGGDVIDLKAMCLHIGDDQYLFSINDTKINWSIVDEGNDKGALIAHRDPNDPVYNQQIDAELERRKE